MVMLVSSQHPKNALYPIFITDSGIVTLFSLLLILNALSSISVVPLGMMPSPFMILYFAIFLCDDCLCIARWLYW